MNNVETQREKVLVLGGSGFLGSHVADELSERGYAVRIFDTRPSDYLRDDQIMVVGDILDQDVLYTAAEGCSYIYNFACISDITQAHLNPVLTNKINVLGNTYALEVAKELKVERYVFASTVYVHSDAGSFYRASKQAAEKFIEAYSDAYGLNYTILRYGSLYGRRTDGRNGIYQYLKSSVLNKTIVYDGSRDAMREYIHASDAAKLSVDILAEKYANKHLILTGKEKLKVSDLFMLINEMLPFDVEVVFNSDKNRGHYEMTPYKYQLSLGMKLESDCYIDLGQGLLDTMNEIIKEYNAVVS